MVNLSRAILHSWQSVACALMTAKPDLDIPPGAAFSLGVLAQCRGRAGAQRHQQKFKGSARVRHHPTSLGSSASRWCGPARIDRPEGVIVLPTHLARTEGPTAHRSLGSHRQKPRGPGANQVSRILRIGRAREQMVRIVQADETLRMSGRL